MKSEFKLTPMEKKSKGDVKRLRKEGYIPVSIQHKGMETLHYQQEARPIEEFIKQHGNTGMVDLMIEPEHKTQRALVHDVQRDPITHQVLQVTFQQIRRDDIVKTQVPLFFSGESEEARTGDYIVQHPINTLDIECEPDKLPDHITINVENLKAGTPLRVSDLPPDSRYKILTSPDVVIASLTSTRSAAVEEEAVPEGSAEDIVTEQAEETGE